MSEKPKSTIGSLKFDAYHPVYRRADGTLWMKLTENIHFPARKKGESYVVDGGAHDLNPNEKVDVLHTADEQMA